MLCPARQADIPLRRVVKLGNPGEATGGRDREMFYVLQDVSCGTRDEEHTIEEWLSKHDHENGEEWFLEWVDALEKTVPLIQFAELFMPDKLVNEIYKVFIRTMYQNYLMGQMIFQYISHRSLYYYHATANYVHST